MNVNNNDAVINSNRDLSKVEEEKMNMNLNTKIESSATLVVNQSVRSTEKTDNIGLKNTSMSHQQNETNMQNELDEESILQEVFQSNTIDFTTDPKPRYSQ